MKRSFSLLLLGTFLVLFLFADTTSAEETVLIPTETNLDGFVNALLLWKEETDIDFLTDWTAETLTQFTSFATSYGFTVQNDGSLGIRPEDSVFGALNSCFYEVFGEDSRFWTLEQQYWRASIYVDLGLETHNSRPLPDEDSLTETEAVELARQKIIEYSGGTESGFGYYGIKDVDACTRVSVSYFDYGDSENGDGKRWFISFYQNIDSLARWPSYPVQDQWYKVFEIDLHEELGTVQLTHYNDPYSMAAYWSDAQAAHNNVLLAMWSLEDKQLLYQTMKNLYMREVIRHGLTPDANYMQILDHIKSIPQSGELTQDRRLGYNPQHLFTDRMRHL